MSIQIGWVPPASGGIGVVPLFHAIEESLARQKAGVHLTLLKQAISPPLQGYLLALQATVPDLHSVKRAAADLILSGVKKKNLIGVLLQEGSEGELPETLVAEELTFSVFCLRVERSILCLSENQQKSIFEISPKSKMALSIQSFSEKISNLRLEKVTEVESANESDDLKIRRFEEVLTARVWKDLTEGEFSPLQPPPAVESVVDRNIQSELLENSHLSLTNEVAQILRQRLLHQLLGWGPIQDLIENPDVGEIMVNGPDQIYIERQGRLEKSEKKFVNEAQLQVVIERMVAASGRRVDTSSPFCDVRLPQGGRVNVVLPPLSLKGPIVTIRRFRPAFGHILNVVREGTLTPEQAKLLEDAVKDRRNIVIAGNTASGKTTLLNLISTFIDEEERIITLEDAAELELQKPHVVRLETRKKNLEGIGEISMSDLVVNSLRMRPDRLIIGECRGPEAIPMLQAMNTGHDGSMTTLHANSALDAVRRLESMVLLGAPSWPPSVIRQQIASAVDLIVYLKRTGSSRRCEEITRLYFDGSEIKVEPA